MIPEIDGTYAREREGTLRETVKKPKGHCETCLRSKYDSERRGFCKHARRWC